MSTAPSLLSASTYRDSVGSLNIMTPGRGALEFSFSSERDNSLGSDPRKGSWHATLPYALERRTMGLELEDKSTNNTLASLREDASDGDGLEDMEMGPPSEAFRFRGNDLNRRSVPRTASGSSVLGIDGLTDAKREWTFDDEGPRPYSESA